MVQIHSSMLNEFIASYSFALNDKRHIVYLISKFMFYIGLPEY